MPMNAERIVVAQWFQMQNEDNFFDLIDNFMLGFGLSAAYLGSILVSGLIIFGLNELRRKIQFGVPRIVKLQKKFAIVLSQFGMNRLSAIGIFVLSFNLFLWLAELFLTNNIKTNKVVGHFFKF